MKLREQLGQPGFVIDMMTAAMILSFPVVVVILLAEGSAHFFYHRGPNWHAFMKSTLQYAVCYAVVAAAIIGVMKLWKRRKSIRDSRSQPLA